MRFSKYSGCGNDFILIDDRNASFLPENSRLIPLFCNRRQGIGADGVILLQNSSSADHKMRIFNADGSEAEMCGNGIRCLARFIHRLYQKSSCFTIESKSGLHQAVVEDETVSIAMTTPKEINWNIHVPVSDASIHGHFLNTGVPHFVTFQDSVESFPLTTLGPLIRRHPFFSPNGTNVNVVQMGQNEMLIRTFERGVEDETLACGTGATAAACAAAHLFGLTSPIQVRVRSGETLTLSFEKPFTNIWMSGPARLTFEGTASLPHPSSNNDFKEYL